MLFSFCAVPGAVRALFQALFLLLKHRLIRSHNFILRCKAYATDVTILRSMRYEIRRGGQWWLAASTGSSFTNSKWATWSAAVTWVDVKAGDFNGDGRMDITGRWLQGGSWWTSLSTGSSFTTSQWASWSTGVTWVDVGVGDLM